MGSSVHIEPPLEGKELLVKVGVYCLRGGGHWACYDEEDASACGTKGPDVFIAVDPDDREMYPEWLQETMGYYLDLSPDRDAPAREPEDAQGIGRGGRLSAGRKARHHD